MADLTVSSAVDTFMQSSDQADMRSAVGVYSQLPAWIYTAGVIDQVGLFITDNAFIGSTTTITLEPTILGSVSYWGNLQPGIIGIFTGPSGIGAEFTIYNAIADSGNVKLVVGYITGEFGAVWAGKYYLSFRSVPQTPADLELGNVDNTSDINKPVSTAQQSALDLKSDISSLGSAAFNQSYDFATAAQGDKADTALQSSSNGSSLVGITYTQVGAASALQGSVADSALQPNGNGSSLAGITIAQVEAASSITPAPDGTYSLPTSITIVKGIITAIS